MLSALARVIAAAIVVVAVAGCALVDGRSAVGNLLTSWSEGQDERIDTVTAQLPMVIADDATRTAFLDRLPDKLDPSSVAGADLATSFLVLGSYGKCQEVSRVRLSEKKSVVEFEVYIPRGDENTECVWAPTTIDVWQIDRSELGATPPQRLQVRTA